MHQSPETHSMVEFFPKGIPNRLAAELKLLSTLQMKLDSAESASMGWKTKTTHY